jgi:hypothetical protein
MKTPRLACFASLVSAAVLVSSAQGQVATEPKPETDKLAACVGDYRQTVRCALAIVLKGQMSLQGAEISPLRPSRLTQPGDNSTCVRVATKDGVGFFAVFLENDKFSDVRRAVAIDGCQNETYTALPVKPPPPAHKKATRHKK